MKKIAIYFAFVMVVFLSACNNSGKKISTTEPVVDEEVSIPDSTVYGVCGDGTMMHTLELITDAGDTLTYLINLDDDGSQPVVGGLLAGDRLAVLEGQPFDGDKTAKKVINLTTLTGKWTSIDKNFEILEGGEVKSNIEAEKNPWTSWKIINGKLLLNRDTFDIDNLGSDSLFLENKDGIFVYKRAK